MQVTNDYGDAVAEAYFNDAESLVDESENTRTWTLMADMEDAYTGAFYVRYQSGTDLAFMQSDFDASVTFGIAQAGADTADTAATAGADDRHAATATAAATATPTAYADGFPHAGTDPGHYAGADHRAHPFHEREQRSAAGRAENRRNRL